MPLPQTPGNHHSTLCFYKSDCKSHASEGGWSSPIAGVHILLITASCGSESVSTRTLLFMCSRVQDLQNWVWHVCLSARG